MPDIVDVINYSLNSDQTRLKVIAQNLANVNTAGYKKEVITQKSFDSMLYPLDKSSKAQASSVLPSMTTERVFSSGALAESNDPFDIAMEGKYFLMVEYNGQTAVTRQGKMLLDNQGRLQLENGTMLQSSGQDVFLDPGPFEVDRSGLITQRGNEIAKLDVVTVSQPKEMVYQGGGLYLKGGAQFIDAPVHSNSILQGYTEASNVNTMEEMVNMIEVSRHFESSHNVLTGYDTILNSAINVLGEL